jgi:hypothetical protein
LYEPFSSHGTRSVQPSGPSIAIVEGEATTPTGKKLVASLRNLRFQ